MKNNAEYEANKMAREKGTSIIDFPSEYVIIDTETTGLDPNFDELIEIGAIKYVDGKEISRFSELIKPSSYFTLNEDIEIDDYCIVNGEKILYIDSFITNLTGITNKMLCAARQEKEVLSDFIKFLGDSIIIGHNVNFDINFLYDSIYKHFSKKLQNNYVDTMRIARKLLKEELSHHRLKDLTKYYNLNYSKAHRAVEDVKITKDILDFMKKDISNKYDSYETFIQLFKRKHFRIRAKEILSQIEEFDEENIFYRKVCVFTGTLEKMQRKDAMQIIANIGAINADTVTKKTNFLVFGNFEYNASIRKNDKSSKLKKAQELKLAGQNIEIISENVFYEMIDL